MYRKVRHHFDRGQFAKVHDWLALLSAPKRKSLFYLLKTKNVLQAFNRSLSFVGPWGGLKPGNIHKHLALHCDELIVLYCNHVRDDWNAIFGLHATLQGSLDPESVQFLEGKAPSVCSNDNQLIAGAMKDGSLLPLVSDADIRKEIASNILKLTGIIPSIATLHENLRYLGIGAQILQKHIEVVPTKSRKGPLTLYQNLRNDWRFPQNPTYQSGNRTVTVLNPTAELSFVILFLAALRDFPCLSTELPL